MSPGPVHIESPAPDTVEEVVRLIRKGRPLSARALFPNMENNSRHWHDAKALTTAARLGERLGAGKVARGWHRLNFRRHRDDDVCFLHRGFELGYTLGFPRVLRIIEARLQRPGLLPKHRADMLALAAGFLGAVRDFERAARLLEEALSLRPREPWLLVCKASLLRNQDRREEALAVCGEALSVLPESGNAIELASGLLIELNRESEAERLLQDGCGLTEIADLRWQLYIYYSERERPEEALHWLNEYERHSPMLPEKARTTLRGNRAALHLLRGDLEAAKADAAACGSEYYKNMAANLDLPRAAQAARLRLPVGFVRQHHVTCAPATLAALAAYWGRPAPHPEIAGKICYDGTTNYSERQWAIDQQLDGREFRVTPEVTRALVSRGVPFTLVTTWTTGAHLQSVIGTDDRAGLLIIRDPTHAHYSEALLDGFLKDYEAHGPRGMLLLPESERARADGIVLPEAALYDRVHAIEAALQSHNRALAQQEFDQLCAAAPGHRLMWQAQHSLAAYDDNSVKAHEAQNALAVLFPEDAPTAWRAFRLNSPRRPRGEILAELERRTGDPKCDSVFHVELARVLADDDRTGRRATRLLYRQLRQNPSDAQTMLTLGNCRWAAGAFDDALELYRLAACAADKNEACAATYFSACRRLNRAEEGLAFLRHRVALLGSLAAAPHTTLADSLEELLRSGEAMQVIQSARRLRPDDASLVLYEARLHQSQGLFSEAGQLLAQAQHRVPPQDWHRQSANLERSCGRNSACIAHWQAVLKTEPMAMDATGELARLIAERDGMEQTLMLLGRTCMQWPWHMGLARLHVDWLRSAGRAQAELELRRILAHNPADDWAWRELALELSQRQRHDEANQAAAESLRLSPGLANSHSIYALTLRAAGRNAEAHAEYRRALTLDVNCAAMHSLTATAASAAERREDIEFLRGELARQAAGGEAVAQFHAVAAPLLTTEEMTAILKGGNHARPDIWETWSTLATHLLNLQSPDALELTREMTARFPGAPGSWRLHSQACAAQGMAAERLAALQRAVDINPQWSQAVRDLAELHEREGRTEAALREMHRVVSANPLDAPNHGVLADMLLRQGRQEEALAALERAVEVEPGYDWGWAELNRQCRKLETPGRVIAAAQKLTASRPDEARSWIVLVETHVRLQQWNEALSEADSALIRWPKSVRLHELRAIVFNGMGRRQEAQEACRPGVFNGTVPRELRAREAALLLDAAEFAAAETLLEDLVVNEPDYAWPRSLLYDICRSRGDNQRCLALSRDLVRIEPDSVVAAGVLAESLINAKQPGEAMTVVRRAIELDPGYAYAAAKLFDDVLERRDFTAAQQLADLMERYQSGPRSQLARARLALAQDKPDDALRPALELIQSDSDDGEWALHVLRESWQKTKTARLERLDQLILNEVKEGRARNPGVSGPWAKLHKAARLPGDLGEAVALPVTPAVRDHIVRDLLYQASDAELHAACLAAVKTHRPLLRSSTMLWGAVSYVLFQAGRHRELVEWSADWRERPDREPWMMANLALALAWDCGPLDAAEAWEAVLAGGASNVWIQAAAGLAFTSAIKSRPDDARRYLDNLRGQELNKEDQYSAAFARIALVAAEAGPGRHAHKKSALLKEASIAWPGGGSTARGQHYRRDLENFLLGHKLDPGFAKVPRSRAPQSSPKVSPWLLYPIVVLGFALVRGCFTSITDSRKPTPPAEIYRNVPPPPPQQPRRFEQLPKGSQHILKDLERAGKGEPITPPSKRPGGGVLPSTPPEDGGAGGDTGLRY